MPKKNQNLTNEKSRLLDIGMLFRVAVSRALRHYEYVLSRAPVRTQAVTCGVLWAFGDVLAQKIEGRRGIDCRRLVLTTLYGAAVITPICHFWYRLLDMCLITHCKWPAGSGRFVAGKVIADTLIMTPAQVLGFFGWMNAVDGGSFQDLAMKCSKDFWPTVLVEMLVWPPFQVVNFARVPLRHQLVVMNCGTILDSAFICWAHSQQDWRPTWTGAKSSV